jgi:hypothetical protein
MTTEIKKVFNVPDWKINSKEIKEIKDILVKYGWVLEEQGENNHVWFITAVKSKTPVEITED